MYQSNYLSVSDAIVDLHSRGFNLDFSFRDKELLCSQQNFFLNTADCNIVETYRFPSRNGIKPGTIVYGIECPKFHLKGILMSTEAEKATIEKSSVRMTTNISSLGYDCWQYLLN